MTTVSTPLMGMHSAESGAGVAGRYRCEGALECSSREIGDAVLATDLTDVASEARDQLQTLLTERGWLCDSPRT